jgi:hypothetical protein
MNRIINIFLLLSIVSTVGGYYANCQISLNRAAYHSSAADYDNTGHLVTDGQLSTYWKSKAIENQWIYIDLGRICKIKQIKLFWGSDYAVAYKLQASSEGFREKPTGWKDIHTSKNGKGGNETISMKPFQARYVRMLCLKSSNKNGYEIKEIEISGTGAEVSIVRPKPFKDNFNQYFLHGENWKLQRQEYTVADGHEISKPGFDDTSWIEATVPGTVLTSYYNIGAVPDILYGDQQLQISENFFTANFWYRNEFEVPKAYQGRRVWLNFDGINWKADIFVNGTKIGRIDGAFIRGRFDITPLVQIGQKNYLAVLIYKNENPGEVTEQHLNDPDPNGGIIGYDSPTILASIGWNWLPTIRGRNIGIWNNVYLDSSGDANIIDPYIITDFNLPDTLQSAVYIQATIQNLHNTNVNATLKGYFGKIAFQMPVNLSANEIKTVFIGPDDNPQLLVEKPRLWWPNGYGPQHIENLKLQLIVNNQTADEKNIRFGFRKYTYSYDNNHLRLHINGVPLILRGGNLGLPEALMRCDNERFDILVKMHRDMNLNMIRNWVGMTGSTGFYDACDKYGIMIWDDFWLANPVDGPHPQNSKMFMENASDKIRHRRNHASLAIWCGRNEGYPPASIDSSLRVMLAGLDNSRHYISSSSDRPVTGLGPYETKDPKWYFKYRGHTLHTEQGIVCVPAIETIKEMMPQEYWWPINDMWGKHDWTQPRVGIFTQDMDKNYGKATSLEDFALKAQMQNMEGPKAMIESWRSNQGGGVIVWMTHPSWPSFICQSYDYYFDKTAAYFAFKKGSEPLHIFWRADNYKIQLANSTLNTYENLSAIVQVFDFNGNKVSENSYNTSVSMNSVVDIAILNVPQKTSPLHFIKLQLLDQNGKILSDNFYWNNKNYQDYNLLSALPKVKLSCKTKTNQNEQSTKIEVLLTNNSPNVALMVRLKLLQDKSGKRVLPTFFTDNYFSLVANETKKIEIEFDNKYIENQSPELIIEGWNIIVQKIKIL